MIGNKGIKHGHHKSPTWYSWWSMCKRCTYKGATCYKDYGGRGITVDKRWLESFLNFLSDMGERPSESHSLGRINNDAGYYKENCEWQDMKTQSINKRNTKYLEYKGQSKSQREWCDILKIDYRSVSYRLRNNWTVKDAFEKPFSKMNSGRPRRTGEELAIDKTSLI